MTTQELYQQWLTLNPNEPPGQQDPGQMARFQQYQQQFLAANNVASLDAIAPGTPVVQPSATGANPFSDPALNTAANNALISGANAAGAGGNANQVQGSTQTGTFGTTGTNNTNQTTGSTGTTTGTTTGTNTGETTNVGSGTNATTGTTTTSGTNAGTGFNNTTNTGFNNLVNNTTGTTATTGSSTNDTNLNRTNTENTSNVGTSAGSNTGTTYGTNVGGSTGNTLSTSTGTGSNTVGTTGAYTGSTTGGQQSTGQSTTGVVDTLGFGDILRGQTGLAAGDDATRRGFLSDLVTTGGDQFQNQVGTAVNRSLSGPGMQGVGDSARARAVGAAVGDVARNNLNSRLAGAAQLAGPTATTGLVSAGNPYLGVQANTSGSGTTYGTSSGTNTGSQVGSYTNNNTGNVATSGTNFNNSTGGSANNYTGGTTNVGTNTSVGNETGRSVGSTSGNTNTVGGSTSAGTSGGSSAGNTGFTNTNLSSTVQDLLNTFSNANRGTTSGSNTGTTSGSTNQTGFNNIVGSETAGGTTSANSTAVAAGNQPQQQVSGGGGGCYVSSILSLDGAIGQRSIRRTCRYKLYERRDRFMPVGYSLIGPAIAWWVVRSEKRKRLVLPAVKAVLYEELRLSGKHLPFKLAPWLWHGLFQSITGSIGFGASLFGRQCVTTDSRMKELLVKHDLYFSVWPS